EHSTQPGRCRSTASLTRWERCCPSIRCEIAARTRLQSTGILLLGERPSEGEACAVHAALHRADLELQHVGRLLIGEAEHLDQEERLSVLLRHGVEGGREL